MPYRLAIFASGSGTNAEEIIKHGRNNNAYDPAIIITNNPEAGVIKRGVKLDVPVIVLSNNKLSGQSIIQVLKYWQIDFIVLAGYLKLIPNDLTSEYDGKIVNIHPALLPSFGGKGMFGMNVHKAVIKAGEVKSGITIHEVNEKYDDGKILLQISCPVTLKDTPDSLAQRIHDLEHQHYPVFLEYWVRGEADKYPKS